jgi:GTPase SAR1 family protein
MNILQALTQLFAKRVQTQTANPSAKIVVLGHRGVGKTQFIHSLIDELRYKRVESRTTKSRPYETYLANSPIAFIDTAGENSIKTQELLENMLHNNEVEGIINVVSYGYIGAKDRVSLEDMIDAETQQIKLTFLETARTKELKNLDTWLPLLTKRTSVRWVITLINQMDIWYPDRTSVMYYYEDEKEKYKQKFKDLKKTDCDHYVLPYSSILELYLDRFPPQIGITQQQQIQDDFTRLLFELIEKI